MHPIPLEDRIIVALDVPTYDEARAIVERLDGVVSFFKVGLQLQLVRGAELSRWLLNSGRKVFLDYKYYDIEFQVREAVKRVSEFGVSFLTVHGNRSIMQAAAEGRADADLKILAVTVLTSLSDTDIQDMGFQGPVGDLVLHRARMAVEAGCDGVIASGREAKAIREFAPEDFLIVTPGIRPTGADRHEQKRAVTPKDAIEAGANHLVVGRPIVQADDPAEAARRIRDEVAQALRSR